jgi:hypothetical protein
MWKLCPQLRWWRRHVPLKRRQHSSPPYGTSIEEEALRGQCIAVNAYNQKPDLLCRRRTLTTASNLFRKSERGFVQHGLTIHVPIPLSMPLWCGCHSGTCRELWFVHNERFLENESYHMKAIIFPAASSRLRTLWKLSVNLACLYHALITLVQCSRCHK